MVLMHVKRGSESAFLFEALVSDEVAHIIRDVTSIFNGRLKIYRICSEIEELANYGTMLPSEMMGLTDEQIEELKLRDAWAEKCIPCGGFNINIDPMGRRNGQQPKENMQEILNKATKDAKNLIDKNLVKQEKPLTLKIIDDAIDLLRGAVTIVYPMQLPPHDNIRLELTNIEDLTGTQASKEVVDPMMAQLWFAGQQLLPEKQLFKYIGPLNKTKMVVKLTTMSEGRPAREVVVTEDVRRLMMADAYRRQEEIRQLEQDDDDEYLNSSWADSSSLKRQVHGLDNVQFRFGK